jgi:glycosyltransferase involved in cell wall biosynthesis
MRILTIVYEFPPIGGGGGRAAQDICLKLVARGHSIRVLTSHYKGLPHRENIGGLMITRVPAARRSAFKASLLDMFAFVISGSIVSLKSIREWKPDVVHVHFAVPSGPVAWVLWRFTRIPYVLTAQLGDVPGGVPLKTDRWFRWVLPFTRPIWHNAAHIVAVSKFTRQLALNHYPGQVEVIPNGVDLTQLDPGEIRVGQPPQIVFAGRFVTQKNPLQLIHTLARLKHLDWQCTLLGDGPLRADIEAEIRSADLESRIKLPGWVTPEDVIQWFLRSDILFMPSLSEGLPVTGVQALALGLCIVASHIGGFVDLVNDGVNGYLIDGDRTSSYVKHLESLLSSPQTLQTFRLASREKAQQFDLNKVTGAYEGIYQDVAVKTI